MGVNAGYPVSLSINCSYLPSVCDEVMGGGGDDWELLYPTFHLFASRVAQATAKPVQEPSLFTCHGFHFALFATRIWDHHKPYALIILV